MTENKLAFDPYPVRTSEYVRSLPPLSTVEVLRMSDTEKAELLRFESELFEEYESATRPPIDQHTVYPGAFLTPEGKAMFEATYLSGASLETAMHEGEAELDAVKRIFMESDLTKIDKTQRRKANRYSSQWARTKFLSEFAEFDGNTGQIENPERLTKVVDSTRLSSSEASLRILKKSIKKQIADSGEAEDDFAEAKKIVLNMYRKRINVALADLYEYKNTDSKSMERVDHFLNGVGIDFDTDGFFETIPATLDRYAIERAGQVIEQSDDYKKYNSVTVNALQAKKIADAIIAVYGWAGRFEVVIDDVSTMEMVSNKVKIPKDLKRGLVDTMVTLAHEIEGHALRVANKKEAFSRSLRLMENRTSGRGGALMEGAAVHVGSQTQMLMVEMPGLAEPYYYVSLAQKKRGGSFKEVFTVFIESHARRRYGMDTAGLLDDPEKFEQAADYCYPRALRLFGRNTPLTDTSGYITTSDVLDYIEMETVTDLVSDNETADPELSKIMYISGVDFYSAYELKKLGLLDLRKVEEPKFAAARIVWPKVKKGLESDKDIDMILAEL